MRIHIVCPGDQVDGSAESLHQFGRAAATLGYDTRIAYEPFDFFGPAPSEFRSYGLRNDQDIPDDPDVCLLVPQNGVEFVAHLSQARKLVWWLRIEDDVDVAAVRAAVPEAMHLVQSEHARRFLELHGLTAPIVGDYVHPNFVERAASLAPLRRLDNVLYNPDPTDQLTPKLIEASKGVLQWVPIRGASRDEVAELMAYCKLYVDFGAHLGATRLPREAIAAGCCVITGRRGAAGNGVDFCVPEGFSFDETGPDVVKDVLNRIALTLMEFDGAEPEFAAMRSAVAGEEPSYRAGVGALLRGVDGAAEAVAVPGDHDTTVERPRTW